MTGNPTGDLTGALSGGLPSPVDAELLARVAGSLVTVLLLALLLARVTRRGLRRRGRGELRVSERIGLTRDSAAVVLEVGGRRLLVGVGPAQVTLLADLGSDATESTTFVSGTSDDVPSGQAGSPDLATEPPSAAVVPAPRPAPEENVRVQALPLSRKALRQLNRQRRLAVPPTQRGSGSVLDPRSWQQTVEALRDLTARRS